MDQAELGEAREQHRQAQKQRKRGDAGAALTSYARLLGLVDAPAKDYDEWVLGLEETGRGGGQGRLAALCQLYRGEVERALASLPAERFPVERAETLQALAGRPVQAARGNEAAELFLGAGLPVRAAVVYAGLAQTEKALACYARLLSDPRVGTAEAAYVRALLHGQLATLRFKQQLESGASGELSTEVARHAAAAQILLEEVAEECEKTGQRDRALDGFRVLAELGRGLGRFENIAEGYKGCLRILLEERCFAEAVKLYEELIALCLAHGEPHSAALACRDAAVCVEQAGFGDGRDYLRRSAEYGRVAAARLLELGASPALVENALLGSLDAALSAADLGLVRAACAVMVTLPLPEPRLRKYQRLLAGLGGGEAAVGVPPGRASAVASAQVWLADLLEWEAGGDPALVLFGLLADGKRPLLTRRNALRGLVLLAQKPAADEAGMVAQRLSLVETLCGLRCHEALQPLERLFQEHGGARKTPLLAAKSASPATVAATQAALRNPTAAARIRRAVVEHSPRLPFRRSLSLIVRALSDPDPGVAAAALSALGRCGFPDAVSGLCRLYRQDPRLPVRQAALVALGQARDARASEELIEALRRDPEPLRGEALRQLYADSSRELRALLLRHVAVSSGAAKRALESLLARPT